MDDAATVAKLGLVVGGILGGLFLIVGVRVRYFQAYGWVAGYNTAPPEEQARYDIEGLAQHLGNGMIALALLILAAPVTFYLEKMRWLAVVGALFFFVVFIIVVGGQKFRPRPAGAPPYPPHRFLRWLLPAKAFAAIEKGTRQWVIECGCGLTRDYWEAGGIRYKAIGERRELNPCARCEKLTWQKVRRR